MEECCIADLELMELSDSDLSSSGILYMVKNILHEIGEDSEQEGLLKTPQRAARMYAEITGGGMNIHEVLQPIRYLVKDETRQFRPTKWAEIVLFIF